MRYVNSRPKIKGMKPFGLENDILIEEGFSKDGGLMQSSKDTILLNYEEYEAIRLSDYENLNQCESAEIMGVSRPTFTRIYKKARRKVAQAMVEGREIIIKGGNIVLNDSWYRCLECGAIFEIENKSEPKCALCSSSSIKPY